MRRSDISYAVVALLLYSADARGEDCKQLVPQSAQIACLQRELDALRSEVAQLRSARSQSQNVDQVTIGLVDQKILEAVTRLEWRWIEKSQPKVYLLDR